MSYGRIKYFDPVPSKPEVKLQLGKENSIFKHRLFNVTNNLYVISETENKTFIVENAEKIEKEMEIKRKSYFDTFLKDSLEAARRLVYIMESSDIDRSRSRSKRQSFEVHSVAKSKEFNKTCGMCGDSSHPLNKATDCSKFRRSEPRERRKMLNKSFKGKFCPKCLKLNVDHRQGCDFSCAKCKGPHHSMLHFSAEQTENSSKVSSQNRQKNNFSQKDKKQKYGQFKRPTRKSRIANSTKANKTDAVEDEQAEISCWQENNEDNFEETLSFFGQTQSFIVNSIGENYFIDEAVEDRKIIDESGIFPQYYLPPNRRNSFMTKQSKFYYTSSTQCFVYNNQNQIRRTNVCLDTGSVLCYTVISFMKYLGIKSHAALLG